MVQIVSLSPATRRVTKTDPNIVNYFVFHAVAYGSQKSVWFISEEDLMIMEREGCRSASLPSPQAYGFIIINKTKSWAGEVVQ